jgi:membrane associated rhomboid family serine protease
LAIVGLVALGALTDLKEVLANGGLQFACLVKVRRTEIMTTATASWRLNHSATTDALRATLLAGTGVFALSVHKILTATSGGITSSLLLALTLYVGVCVLLVHWYLRNRERERSIRFCDGVLSIPRIVLKPQLVRILEIKSVEKWVASNKFFAVRVGRFNKGTILIQRRSFACESEFEDFALFLTQFPSMNQCAQAAEGIAVISARNDTTNSMPINILALTLFFTYAVLAAPNVGYISDEALFHGGLTKEALLISQLYRIPSSFFLHSSPVHLGANIFGLAIIGRHVDVILGRVRFIQILFGAAISGSLLSFAFSSADIVVGASGGLMGLLGAYFLLIVKHHQYLPGSVSTSGKAISLALALQLLSDLTSENVDIFSHLGGFLFGILYASWLLHRRPLGSAALSSRSALGVAATMTLAYATGLAYFLALSPLSVESSYMAEV